MRRLVATATIAACVLLSMGLAAQGDGRTVLPQFAGVTPAFAAATRDARPAAIAQKQQPQGKLVRAARGEIFDVAADIDPRSATFGRWVGVTLSDTNHRQLWIPPGYAHGFVVLSEIADFEYKCTDYYHPESETGVIWNDPDLGIAWPIENPQLSDKDKRLPTLASLASKA